MATKEPKWLELNGRPILEHFESLSRAVRITAFVLLACDRFKGIRLNEQKILGLLTKELQVRAVDYWIKYSQWIHLKKELLDLSSSDPEACKSSSILNLNPFIDTDGLIRVGGRIEHANITFDERHPIVIPGHSVMSKRLLRQAHELTLHGGVQLMLHFIRARY